MIDSTIQPPRLESDVKAKINTKTPQTKHGMEGIIAIIFMSFIYMNKWSLCFKLRSLQNQYLMYMTQPINDLGW